MEKFYTPSYEITPLTLAVVADRDQYGHIGSWILDEDEEHYISGLTPTKMIDYACRYFGANLKGRQEGTRDICGITHKAPISINPMSGMYFFPTISPANAQCSWISHTHIKRVNKAPKQHSEIVFTNGRKLLLNVSFGSIINQVQRTAQFRYLLDSRLKQLKNLPPLDPNPILDPEP
ncbi:MAG TPA: competence protein ComK [Cerasibacillus sp.]|uniref:competence protein ComK n=1 Tax=Cerasibacillus sp. TaxID=2498711 RepID=UPI002F409D57